MSQPPHRDCSCDAKMADFSSSSFFQNAEEGPTEHVQKGAAADRLYGVSLGTADQCIVTQKPHRYNTACSSLFLFPPQGSMAKHVAFILKGIFHS